MYALSFTIPPPLYPRVRFLSNQPTAPPPPPERTYFLDARYRQIHMIWWRNIAANRGDQYVCRVHVLVCHQGESGSSVCMQGTCTCVPSGLVAESLESVVSDESSEVDTGDSESNNIEVSFKR